jgi:hypothetical protein
LSETIPFIKWGTYSSKNDKVPDVLELQIVKTETFETEYSINAEVKQRENDSWQDKILPLKSFNSENDALYRKWIKLVKSHKIKNGSIIRIKTWLGVSKNNHTIRRFEIEV